MIIAAALLSINLDLTAVFSKGSVAPTPTCHITTVSHKFVGTPGTTFRYEGATYRIPQNGSIELIAAPKTTTYEVAGRQLPLNVFARDAFGTETVQVPTLND